MKEKGKTLTTTTNKKQRQKGARRTEGYCLCYCKAFSLVPDPTKCTKIYVTEKSSTSFVSPKIK